MYQVNERVAGFIEQQLGVQQPLAWLDRLEALVARELAPSARKIRTALRIATIVTIAIGLDASCHVNSPLGAVIVWLLAGAGPMMSIRKALTWQIAVMLALITSVMMARAFAETPWLMLPFVFVWISLSTYVGATRKLGVGLLVIQIVCLITFYGVVFAPQEIGWNAAASFDGSAIAFGVVVLFDNWLWPDPGEPILMESLRASVARARSELLGASIFFLASESVPRPPLPASTSDLPAHMALLDQALVEGASERRRAILLAAITRAARISLEVDRLITTARENLPREIRTMVAGEIQKAVNAIAAALDEISHNLPARIAVGADEQAPATLTHLRLAMDSLAGRVVEIRPAYIGKASPAEIENFAEFIDSLAVLTRLIERPLDEPPRPPTTNPSSSTVPRLSGRADPAVVRYCLKVGLCIVVGYLIGLITQRPDLFIILMTVITTATPTYGATMHKMSLRIAGAIIGGAVSLLAIIIVTPNFDTLPTYMLVSFAVFYPFAYASIGNARMSYAGKQMGIIFSLVFIGLSPSSNIYEPLWRIWGVLLGDFVVAIVFFTLWPEYAGDSLLPRLRRVIANMLALAPSGSASSSEDSILKTNSETMRVLTEFLEIAEDARMEGRTCSVYHDGIVEAAGTLRRIANRLSSIATARVLTQMPQLDPVTESARERVFNAIRGQLISWLDFFSGAEFLSASAARAIAETHLAGELAEPLNEFSSHLEEGGFARLASWPLEPRRTMMAELQSMRRLEFLFSELNLYLADIPSSPRPASRIEG
ncbi:FUSC family protein [Candidatus Binatus sp.]|uniref:FUSC family protein n=1 Tax=Candidatus Binatus sp. TaxID=2811406 RepID=UPI003C62F6E6